MSTEMPATLLLKSLPSVTAQPQKCPMKIAEKWLIYSKMFRRNLHKHRCVNSNLMVSPNQTLVLINATSWCALQQGELAHLLFKNFLALYQT
jgi:hypothetical protein